MLRDISKSAAILALSCKYVSAARCSSVVERPLMDQGSSDRSLMVYPLSYFSVTNALVCAMPELFSIDPAPLAC